MSSDSPASHDSNLSCSISMCRNYKNTYSNIDLYPLPKISSQREKFCKILGIPITVGEQPTARVCALHFKSKVYAMQNKPHVFLDDGRRSTLTPVQPKLQVQAPSPNTLNTSQQKPTKIVSQSNSSTITSANPESKQGMDDKLTSESISSPNISTNEASKSANSQESSTNIQLHLECDEDILSTPQLNSYMSDLMAFISANEIVKRIPPTSQPVQTSSTYTQTDIFCVQASNNPSAQTSNNTLPSDSAPLISDVQGMIQKENTQLSMNSAALSVPSVFTPPSVSISSVPSNVANPKNPYTVKLIPAEGSNALPNSLTKSQNPALDQSLDSNECVSALSPAPVISIANTIISPSATTTALPNALVSLTKIAMAPSSFSTVKTTAMLTERSKLYEYLSKNAYINKQYGNSCSFTVPPETTSMPQFVQIPSSVSSNTVSGGISTFMNPNLFQNVNVNQTAALNSVYTTSASSTLLSFAAATNIGGYSNQLVNTNCGVSLPPPPTSQSSSEFLIGVPGVNQVIDLRPPPHFQLPSQQAYQLSPQQPYQVSPQQPYQLSPQQPYQLSSQQPYQLSQQPYRLSSQQSYQISSQQPYQISSQQPYQVITENSRTLPVYNNFPMNDVVESTNPMLLPKSDQPNVNFITNPLPREEIIPLSIAQGPGNSVYSYTVPSFEFSSTTEDDPDIDADALGLCNVATVYGPGTPPLSSTPSEQTPASNQSIVSGGIVTSSGLNVDNSSNNVKINNASTSKESESSETFQNSMGIVIMDVLSAKDGAKEYFIGDKIPELLFDKNKKNVNGSAPVQDSTDETKNEVNYAKDYLLKLFYKQRPEMQQKDPISTIVLKHSIFSLQDSIPVIPNGTAPCNDARKFFNIKMPFLKNRDEEANALRNRLRGEKFIIHSVWWLIQRKYMPMNPPCGMCGSNIFLINRNEKYFDGYCWKCKNPSCLTEEPIKRPKFFEGFKFYSLEDLLLLTYHWACQSSLEEIQLDVDMDSDKIWLYFKALQDLCHVVTVKKGKLGISPLTKVEAHVVKLGDTFVFGALDRKSRYARLEALTSIEAYNSMRHITLLEEWLEKNAVLVTDKKIPDDLLPGVKKSTSVPSATDIQSSDPHCLNILKYLTKNLTHLFGKVNQHTLMPGVVQGFLYELQWRGKYGKFVDMSFWSIMNHIREYNDDPETDTVITEPGKLRVNSYVMKMSANLKYRWGPPVGSSLIEGRAIPANSPFASEAAVQLSISGKSMKSYSKVQKQAKPADDISMLLSSKVKSLSDLFQDVPEIPGGSSYITSRSLLAIKIRFDDTTTSQDFYKSDAICLGLRLRTEGFISNPVKWLVKKGYIKATGPCYVCKKPSFLKESHEHTDGCSWLCQNTECKFENMFKRPKFFARFAEYPMAHIAAMIFHWTVQSDIEIVTSDAPMDSCKISHAWRAFQVVCCATLRRENYRIGGENHIVEVALVQYGKLYILGARDRKTKRTLLRSFPVESVRQVGDMYRQLTLWIVPKSYVVINSTDEFVLPSPYKVVPADTFIINRTSTSFHVLNITSYLLKHISNMFGHLKSDLVRHELIQIYLDELMWRERFGQQPQLAFAKIMYEIFYEEKYGKTIFLNPSLEKQFGKETLLDEPLVPSTLKEARVVLQKIPKTVLKYYGCLLPDCATKENHSPISRSREVSLTDGASSDSSDDTPEVLEVEAVVHKEEKKLSPSVSSSSSEDISLGEVNPGCSLLRKKYLECNKKPKFSFKKAKRFTKVHKNSFSKIHQTATVSSGPLEIVTEKISEDKLKSSELSPSVRNGVRTNCVQPLVIKMHKKRNKIRSYLKSEFVSVTSKNSPKSEFSDKELSPKYLQTNTIPGGTSGKISDAFKNDKVEPSSVDSLHPIQNSESMLALDEKPSSSKLSKRRSVMLRRLDKSGPECIECGRTVNMDHFMKEFSCTDCKNIVYTTCCSNAFCEHRSSLLFGKRVPRRNKVNHGLHRVILLQHPGFCSCGFNSRQGNKLASHLVQCQKITCFYPDEL